MTRRRTRNLRAVNGPRSRRAATRVHTRDEAVRRLAAAAADHRIVAVARDQAEEVAHRLSLLRTGSWFGLLDPGGPCLLEVATAADLGPIAARGHVDVLIAISHDVPDDLAAAVLGDALDPNDTAPATRPALASK